MCHEACFGGSVAVWGFGASELRWLRVLGVWTTQTNTSEYWVLWTLYGLVSNGLVCMDTPDCRADGVWV